MTENLFPYTKMLWYSFLRFSAVVYPGILFRGGSTNSVEDRENGELGVGSPPVRGSGGSCNLVEETSFCMVKFS